MAAFVPSPHQRAIFDFIDHGRGSAIVKAVAGSGKSTTIRKALLRIPVRATVQVFAFNADVTKEMREKAEAEGVGRNVRISTFHSIGFAAVCKHLGRRDVKPDSGKCRKLFRATQGEETVELYGDFVCKLVGLAKGEGFGAIRAASEGDWLDLISHHDLFLDSEDADEGRAVELARGLLRASNDAAREGVIDYDDQLYLPLLWRLRLWQNDFVFIDEAQDTNPVRRAIAKLALRPGGRLVAVGDPRQAIYGFTGASHDALDLIQREFNCVELPLTVSYRCAQSIVRHAQSIVPYLEAHGDAPEGEVAYLPLLAPESSTFSHAPRCALEELGDHDAVLCRNTAPLIKLAYGLMARERKCVVLGRDIGSGLAALVDQMRAKGVDNLIAKLERFREREVAKHTAAGEEQKAESVSDRVDCVRIVIDNLPETIRTVPGVKARIEGLFSDHNGCLTLCTAHKSKGKEWDRVAVLRPDLMPSKWARQEWQALQEQNLMYVAWTRAKAQLIFLTGEL